MDSRLRGNDNDYVDVLLAEREGFEPPRPFTVYRLSKAAHSATMRPLLVN